MNDDKPKTIADYGRATRFVVGGRNDPCVAQRRASSPWSIRRSVRRLMGVDLDISKMKCDADGLPVLTRADLHYALTGGRGRPLTGAEILAVEFVLAALRDWRAMRKIVDMSDGRLK